MVKTIINNWEGEGWWGEGEMKKIFFFYFFFGFGQSGQDDTGESNRN